MSLSVFYYCICACLRRCRTFNPSLCRLSPFHLSYVTVSRPCRLSKFTLTGPPKLPNPFLNSFKSIQVPHKVPFDLVSLRCWQY